jgi:hypothetical protein
MGDRNVAEFYQDKENLIREQQIALQTMKLTGERLAHCFRTEGVNQLENCKDLREKYWALCNDRYRGMIFPVGEEPSNKQVPGLIPPPKQS